MCPSKHVDEYRGGCKSGCNSASPSGMLLAKKVLGALKSKYPNPRPHLMSNNPWELLVATMLAAQCTDARVNQVTPALFAKYPTVAHFAEAGQEDLERMIHSTGFFRNKAKNIIASARKITQEHGGKVPETMPELVALDGVARKTANVVLWGAYGKNEGLAVDTHVARISVRLGLSPGGTPEQIEKHLCAVFPREDWGTVNHLMVSFGRDVCKARGPECGECSLGGVCPRVGVKAAERGGVKKHA